MTSNPPKYEPSHSFNMNELNFILKYRRPVACPDFKKWMRWKSRSHRKVRRTYIGADIMVSTVFLSINHSQTKNGPSVLFETMVFKGLDGVSVLRACTWREALRKHWTAVNYYKGYIDET